MPRHRYDRQLQGDAFVAADVVDGSTAASRFADPHVRLLSFDLDREAADIRENPVPANSGYSPQAGCGYPL